MSAKTSGVTWVVGAIFAFLVLKACVLAPAERASAEDEAAKRLTSEKAQAVEVHVQYCRRRRGEMTASYERLLAAAKPWEAARAFEDCHIALDSKDLKDLVSAAELQYLMKTAGDPKGAPKERVSSIEAMQRDHPEDARRFEKNLPALKAKLAATLAAEQRASMQANAAARKKTGVSIGMTADEIRGSSWGRPEKINKTILPGHVNEQWVYPGDQYLYLEDGILTAIQTH